MPWSGKGTRRLPVMPSTYFSRNRISLSAISVVRMRNVFVRPNTCKPDDYHDPES
jgi:hypothetical protein